FWPASGVAAGILITFGPRVRPALVLGVVVGTIAANFMGDRSLWTSTFKGICNAGEAVLAAWLLERWYGRPFTFGDLRRVLAFVAAAGIATAFRCPGPGKPPPTRACPTRPSPTSMISHLTLCRDNRRSRTRSRSTEPSAVCAIPMGVRFTSGAV